jgi:acyl-CoA synthetase (AMP-forming)/AMP-acid ligase II
VGTGRSDVLLPEQLRLMAGEYPAETAYAVVDGGSMTFAEWDAEANRMARGLVTRGVAHGDRVGIHLVHEAALQWLTAYAAVHRAGAVAVPMNPRLAPAEVARMLAHCGARAVVAGGDLAEQDASLPESLDGVTLAVELVVEVGAAAPTDGRIRRVPWDSVRDDDGSDFQVPTDNDDLADILYTSGTTGRPKGVAVRHVNASLVPGGVPPWSGNRWLHASPFYTFAGSSFVYNPMKLGLCGVYLPRFDAGRWLRYVSEERPTAVFLVPAMAQLVLTHEDVASADLGSVELCSVGSAPLAPSVLEQLQALMPDALVSNNYGMTEAGSAYCIMPKGEAVKRPGSVGMPAPPAKVRIVDGEGGELARGEVGEVQLSMPGRHREYYADADATAALWVDGWLRTGDLGKVDDEGYLYIVGREKDVIIRGGNNVHATDVEHAILTHPAVLEAGVVGMPHDVLGEDVVTAVVLRPSKVVTGDELRAHCTDMLADYKVPRRWHFVDALPRNATGKIVKPELRRVLGEIEGAPSAPTGPS